MTASAPTSQPSPLPWMIEAAKELFPRIGAAMTLHDEPAVRHAAETEIRHVAEIIARHAPTDSREKRLEAALMSIVQMTDADDPISYRSDDREDCLDAVFAKAFPALRPGE